MGFCTEAESYDRDRGLDFLWRGEEFFRKENACIGKRDFKETVWEKCEESQKGRSFIGTAWRKEVLHVLKQYNNLCSLVLSSSWLLNMKRLVILK